MRSIAASLPASWTRRGKMRLRATALLVLAGTLEVGAALSIALAAPTGGPAVHRITIDGIIAPSTARFIVRAVREAEEESVEALIVQLDTPGGLLQSTEDITRALLNSKVPVVVYIAPRGARAASAGVFITYAAHVAAMAPATHLGAATPVSVGGGQGERQPDRTLMEKITNDAVANIRAMARRHGRNADWAEKAVRQAVSIPEDEAVKLNVVNFIADDINDLLRKLDGRTVETARGPATLRTARARIVDHGMDLTERFLSLLSNPDIGFILLNVGTLGILAEIYNPGAVLPGVIGGIALILGLASFAILQVNAAGLLLIGFAILLFIADIKVPAHGVLTVGGVISFVFGSLLLTQRQAPILQISLRLILAVAALLAAFFLFAVSAGVRAQRAKPRSGGERLVDATGTARTRIDPEGMVHVQGEMWSAISVAGPIDNGQAVRVVGLDGLRLRVKPEPSPR